MTNNGPLLADIIRSDQGNLLKLWTALQLRSAAARRDLISDDQLSQQSREFLDAFAAAAEGGLDDVNGARWQSARDVLATVAAQRARQGFSPSETATFVMSLKQPLFDGIRSRVTKADDVASALWQATEVLDRLALFTTEIFQKSREETISRHQSEMLELSTPVVTLWQGVLALPLIGTLDSERTQVVMEALLQRIVETGSTIAILDITGVPTVDTLVAQHLLKTVAASRLMGADCIISGIRPQIAQTIVHLGVDLNSVTTKATLADAFAVALKRLGLGVAPVNARIAPPPGPTSPSGL